MLANMLSMGGVWTYVAIGFGLVGGVLAVLVAFAFGFARWRLPMTIGWLGLTGAALSASLATGLSRMSFTAAINTAAPEVRISLIAGAIAEALYAQVGMLMILPLAFLLFAAAACIPTAVAVGEEPMLDQRGILGAVGGTALGLVTGLTAIAAVLGFQRFMWQGPAVVFMPLMTVLATMTVWVASVRLSSSNRTEQGRVAASRIAVTVAASISVVLLGYLFTTYGALVAFEAVARASADQKAELLQLGLEVAGYTTKTGWCLALVPLFAGIGSVGNILGRVEGRQWAGMVVASVQLVLVLGSLLFIAWTTSWMFSQLVAVF